MVRNSKKLEHAEVTALLMEISQDYHHTMNGIIFDKYLSESATDLIPHGLVLPPKVEEEDLNYYGMLELEANKGAKEIWMYTHLEVFKNDPKDFTELFKQFCLQSLLIAPEAISAFVQIRAECNKIIDYEFFNLNIPANPFKLDEFKHE